MLIKNDYFSSKKADFLAKLASIGYSKRSIRDYRRLLDNLENYMVQVNETDYNSEIGRAFLEHKKAQQARKPRYWKQIVVKIRRFDEFCFDGGFTRFLPQKDTSCPIQFSDILDKYIEHLTLLGRKNSTLKFIKENCIIALKWIDSKGIGNFGKIKPPIIYDLFEHSTDKANLATSLRGLFRYLFKEGHTLSDLSLFVPSIRRKHPIPSVYTKAETEMLLLSFEKQTATQKRDYAVVMLALRLGIRTGDIVNLKISDLDFQTKKITFIQKKTQMAQQLEMLPEIEEALIAHLSCRKQDSGLQNVFLSASPPISSMSPSAVHFLISKHLKKAGVDTKGRKRGGHSLRATFASELVSERVPYDIVRKLLGHDDPRSAKNYVKFDIESLRSCALKVPTIGGKLRLHFDMVLEGL